MCEDGGAYCNPFDNFCPPVFDFGTCASEGGFCEFDSECPPDDVCLTEFVPGQCLPTTCEFSADEDIPQYSWKFDPLRPPGQPLPDTPRWTTVIDDPVQSTVDVLDGLPFDPSQVGVGECLFDPTSNFRSAVVAYVPQQVAGYQCCIWDAFCPSCGVSGGLFEFKWGSRQNEVAHHGDGDGIPTQCRDNCPLDDNPDQLDADGDGVGFACDPDDDDDTVPPDSEPGGGDGIRDPVDNCPDDFNPLQVDTDGDFVGDVCDPTPTPEPALVLQLGAGALATFWLGGGKRGRTSRRSGWARGHQPRYAKGSAATSNRSR